MATTLTPYTRNHPVNLLRCSCCCSRCCLKSNKSLHTPNHVGLSCGIVVFQPPRSRRWLVVVCHHQQSLARYAVLMRSSSKSRLSSLPAAVGPPSPLSLAAVMPSLLMSMVGPPFPAIFSLSLHSLIIHLSRDSKGVRQECCGLD